MVQKETPLLVLGSGSPRRRDLLESMGIPFEVRPSDAPEESQPGESARDQAARLAREKAQAVVDALPQEPRRVVLGADTVVSIGQQILGKPRDPDHALELLQLLSGKTHEVITAFCLLETDSPRRVENLAVSRVRFRETPVDALREYVATGEPMDKAGAYGLQGKGRFLVERVEGSETNVIGLPVEEVRQALGEIGVDLPGDGNA